MSDNNDIIDWFRSSTAYINAHRGKTFVVFLSGETLADDNLPNLVCDLSLLHSLGVKLVLVHGARPQISAAIANQTQESLFVNNLRITEEYCMDAIKATVGSLGIDLEARFSMGMQNSPMHGSNISVARGNFVTGRPVGVLDGIDYHFTGKVRKIQAAAIQQQLDANNLVIMSNLGYSATGEVFNLSAEEVATETAIALKAEKLILLIPSEGVTDTDGKLVASLTESDVAGYVDELSGRSDEDAQCVARALQASLHAYKNDVHRSHLISYKENGAMLLELFTRTGHGSLMSRDSLDQLREATIDDVGGILNLIRPLEEAGTLVTRSRELLENEIGNFKVVELEDTIIACAALYPISDDSGEIACIAIHPQFQKQGFGKRLLESLEKTAAKQNMNSVFVLTTEAAHYFKELGYTEGSVDSLPDARQKLYNLQRKSKVFTKELG